MMWGSSPDGWWFLALPLMVICMWMMMRMMGHRVGPHGGGWASSERPDRPERILAERLARGEIGIEEYERRLAALRTRLRPDDHRVS